MDKLQGAIRAQAGYRVCKISPVDLGQPEKLARQKPASSSVGPRTRVKGSIFLANFPASPRGHANQCPAEPMWFEKLPTEMLISLVSYSSY